MIVPEMDGTSALKQDGRYTLEDWRSWPEGERWELIDGKAYCMSPAPRRKHQKFAGQLYYLLYGFLEGKPCEAYIAPIDVFFPEEREEGRGDTVVQPDVLVVCDQTKLLDEGIRGAPDFIAEILSDSTALKDLDDKRALYERNGVREYWVVRPDGGVFAWSLEGGRYAPAKDYPAEVPVPSTALPGFSWPSREPLLQASK